TLFGGFAEGAADLPVTTRSTPVLKSPGSGTAGEKFWRRAQRDGRLRRAAAEADVLVALDPPAVHTVWQLAQRNRAADAVMGLSPALKQVEIRAAQGFRRSLRRALLSGPSLEVAKQAVRGRAKRYGRAAAVRATGARVQRTGVGRAAWQSALRAPLPDRARLPLARQVAEGLARAGFPDEAGSTLTAVAKTLPQPRRRARFLTQPVLDEFRAGRTPTFLLEAVSAEFASADAALAKGDKRAAAASALRATDLMFNRVAHYDSLTSPAAPDPVPFFTPMMQSTTMKALGKPRGRSAVPLPAAVPLAADRPHRLLFLYRNNDNFLSAIRTRYEQHDGFEVRSFDTQSDERLKKASVQPLRFNEHVLGVDNGLGSDAEAALRPLLDWADTVFVDWLTPAAGLLSLVDPGSTRVIVRLHSFEVFTAWPQVTDLSRVDDLVFVSDHLRDYTTPILPHLTETTRVWSIPNAMDLQGYDRPKPASARYTLGLVGISAVAKDPRWAIEVLRLLRAEDDRYRLLLIGSDLNGKVSGAARQYQRAFLKDVKELGDAVELAGHTEDVAAALTGVGTILSSSVRESFHVGLVEGAASHAVPVVRDWPFFPGGRLRGRADHPGVREELAGGAR
ncbi:glycosyltransferase family 1 protein, partial [Actinoplanes sp. NPDC051633]|uniref:glycosyltransferase family 1 protein n=1 Tax=Actinoplanes sp. NPDC051633 TaxID=3155670 RepID=UPI003444D447